MATIINNPGGGESTESGIGLIVGGVIFLVAVFLFFIYALPALRDNNEPQQPAGNIDVNVELPAGNQTPTE